MVGAGSPQSRCVLRKVGEACERHHKTPVSRTASKPSASATETQLILIAWRNNDALSTIRAAPIRSTSSRRKRRLSSEATTQPLLTASARHAASPATHQVGQGAAQRQTPSTRSHLSTRRAGRIRFPNQMRSSTTPWKSPQPT